MFHNPNLEIAHKAMAFAKKRFPLGGINRKDVCDTKMEEVSLHVLMLDKLNRHLMEPFLTDQEEKQIQDSLKGGYCNELACITRETILNTYPKACVEIVDFDDHQLILIGRKRGNPNDIRTWIDEKHEGVFLDVWAEQIYLISELEAKRKGPNIPWYVYDESLGDNILQTTHYLSGHPKIMPQSNHYKDENDVSIKALIHQKNQDSPNPKTLYSQGISFYKKNQYDECINCVKQALAIFEKKKMSSEMVGCYSTLASCYRELCQYDKALKYCSNALSLASNYKKTDIASLQEKEASIVERMNNHQMKKNK